MHDIDPALYTKGIIELSAPPPIQTMMVFLIVMTIVRTHQMVQMEELAFMKM
jgi:hypothetical protein